MKETMKLQTPLLVNGKNLTELTYDPSEITVDLFGEANEYAMSAGGTTPSMRVKETDYAFHMYLGFAAIIAVNPGISFDDLKRLKGYDLMTVTNIGLFFILGKSGDDSQDDSSESASEDTADISTPVSETQEVQE